MRRSVKARGKAAIISLVKYLRTLSIEPFVIHDCDQGTAGAEVFNPHIFAAVGTPERVAMLEECIEHALGYQPPSADKPYHEYRTDRLGRILRRCRWLGVRCF